MFRYFFILLTFFSFFGFEIFAQNVRNLGMKASEEEIYKYYGNPEIDKKQDYEINDTCECEEFELDHSKDELVYIDLWTGIHRMKNEGKIKIKGLNKAGEYLDFSNDLGLQDKDTTANFGVDLFFIGAHLGFSMSKSFFKGTSSLQRNFTIGDEVYNAGTNLESRMDYKSYRGIIGYTGYLNKHFGIGFEICFDYMKVDYEIKDRNNPRENSGDIEIYTPSFGFNFNWSPVDRLLFSFGTEGTWTDISNKEVWFVSPYATLRFFPTKILYLFFKGGYRLEDYKLNEKKVYLDSQTGSWNIALGLGMRF